MQKVQNNFLLTLDLRRYILENFIQMVNLLNIGQTHFIKKLLKIEKKSFGEKKAEIILERLDSNIELVDIGGGYGIFAEVVREISKNPITIIEPNKRAGFNL